MSECFLVLLWTLAVFRFQASSHQPPVTQTVKYYFLTQLQEE